MLMRCMYICARNDIHGRCCQCVRLDWCLSPARKLGLAFVVEVRGELRTHGVASLKEVDAPFHIDIKVEVVAAVARAWQIAGTNENLVLVQREQAQAIGATTGTLPIHLGLDLEAKLTRYLPARAKASRSFGSISLP